MKAVLQRVKYARVKVGHETVGQISKGILILLGVEKHDAFEDADFLAGKILDLRIFDDEQGKMNLSTLNLKSQILVVSQFTLLGDCSKGRRPSFDRAADPREAEDLYTYFVDQVRKQNIKVETGRFRAMMDVELLNDGPVTFILDSKKRN